jgi:hypothetical protein
MYKVFSVCCIYSDCHLVMAFNAIASVFTSLLASDCCTTNSYSSNCCLKSLLVIAAAPRYITLARTVQKTNIATNATNNSSRIEAHIYFVVSCCRLIIVIVDDYDNSSGGGDVQSSLTLWKGSGSFLYLISNGCSCNILFPIKH